MPVTPSINSIDASGFVIINLSATLTEPSSWNNSMTILIASGDDNSVIPVTYNQTLLGK